MSLVAGAVDAAVAVPSGWVVAQSGSLTRRAVTAAARVFGLSLVAGGLAAVVALLYRWYVRERVPGGLPALVGLSGVALYLGSSQTLRTVITPTGSGDPLDEATALFNIVAFVVALLATRAGTDIGDRVGSDLFAATGTKAVESEVSRVVQAVGRVITVEVPEEIDDIVGYDPVPAETKEKLAGKSFVFPRRLTVDELRNRLVTRLKADYAVGHVDVELADDGTVEYIALGSRAAGIGPTLPPETSAVAVRADPAFAASAGDLVQVWRTDPVERLLTAEVRGTVDDIVTLAVDAADTRKLDATARYRLVTLPVETRPDREFASLLRAAEETMATVTVGAGSPLDGQPVGALGVTVVAVRPTEGPVEPLPGRDRLLAAGDGLYLVATPDAIRKVEAGATPRTSPSELETGSGASLSPDERVDATTPVAGDADDDATAPRNGTPDETAGSGEAGASVETVAAGADDSTDAVADDSADAVADADDSADRPSDEPEPVGDDLSDVDAPGIEALEDDGADDQSPDGGPDDTPVEESDDPLADLAGTDVDDLDGTSVDVGDPTGLTDGADGESPDVDGDDAEAVRESVLPFDEADEGDGAETDGDAADGAETDEERGDGDEERSDGDEERDGGDEESDDGGGWTTALDEHRDGGPDG